MKTIHLDELKIIQMDVLSVVHEFCTQNNIKYSLGCGTLLGAVRHKGYIPWDDDIDIYMLRNDYNRFIKIFPIIYKNIKVASLERDKQWPRAYSQAYDDRTIMQDGANDYQVGVGIDIFPIDYVPEDESDWHSFNNKRKFLQNLYDMKSIGFSKKRGLAKNLLLVFFKLILLPISLRSIGEKVNKHARSLENCQSKYVFENSQGVGLKNRFDVALFDDIIEIPFEDRMFMSFSNFNNYLSNSYGDYMQLPPVEKRVSHHAFKAYWKE